MPLKHAATHVLEGCSPLMTTNQNKQLDGDGVTINRTRNF